VLLTIIYLLIYLFTARVGILIGRFFLGFMGGCLTGILLICLVFSFGAIIPSWLQATIIIGIGLIQTILSPAIYPYICFATSILGSSMIFLSLDPYTINHWFPNMKGFLGTPPPTPIFSIPYMMYIISCFIVTLAAFLFQYYSIKGTTKSTPS